MFVHLRLHTEFSVVDGTTRVDDVVAAAARDRQPALAITDFGNLFGAIKFYKAARGAGVKPLIGAEVLLEGREAEQDAPSRVLLLVVNHQGYLNLSELLARAWTQGVVKAQAVVRWAWLAELADGLILLSGAQAGPVGQALLQGRTQQASDAALKLAELFPHRFYLELQRAGRRDDEAHVAAAVQLAARLKLPVVATHPVQFATPDDYEAHEARVCIAEGEILGNPRRVRRFTPEQYFKSSAEMAELFADLPSAVANAAEIAKRCNLTLVLGKPQLPEFPVPDGHTIETYFRQASLDGLEERLQHLYPDAAKRDAERPRYLERLEFEIGTILKMGFPGYFLIVGDFINWAKANGCPVGPGRGSGAGSLVAYALKITDLDPLEYALLFERFLNPERVSMPDFDIDFCQANRDRVIDYVKDKYGKNAVSQIATFGTMAARAAIRDVGRVLDMSYTFCDGISKLIPNKPGQHITIDGALKVEPILAERLAKEDEVKTLLALAQKLEGLTRNIGMHAGGVLIAPGKLTDFCPLYQQPGSESAVSQYDKDDVEAVGLVKFDFLGLATLTILEIAKELIVKRHPGQADFAFENIPLVDKDTYKLFQDGRTEAVFQFESRGMQGMLRDARPTRLEDLIALNALYRPGPMDLIPSFVARKHGREPVEYPHPLVADMLSETYGIMVYQEQVMQTAQILGGYSLGGADLLRRAMGKKNMAEMAKQRATFIEGAAKNGVEGKTAGEVFDLMEKFANYGFNKSHAAAYALVSYQTAYLKAHHPVAFLAASMTLDMDKTEKLASHMQEASRLGIKVLPPDINRSGAEFVIEDGQIRFALAAIKRVGLQAMRDLVAARDEGGPFASLADFAGRVDPKLLNKMQLENLAKAGAFDSLEGNRAKLVLGAETVLRRAQASAEDRGSSQIGLFGEVEQGPALLRLPETPEWPTLDKLGFEAEAIGFHLSAHPLDEYRGALRRLGVTLSARIADTVRQGGAARLKLAGTVTGRKERNTRTGSRMAWVNLSDQAGGYEVTFFSEVLSRCRDMLEEGSAVLVTADARLENDALRLTASDCEALDKAAAGAGQGMRIFVDAATALPDIRALLEREGRGKGSVAIVPQIGPGQEVEVALPERWNVGPRLMQAMKVLKGVTQVEEV